MTETYFIDNAALLIPVFIYLFKILIWTIAVIGSALCSIILYLGKGFKTKVDKIDGKLDSVMHVIQSCESCNTAFTKYGKRASDITVPTSTD